MTGEEATMEEGRNRLRDRMLRDAILQVLRGPLISTRDGNEVSPFDAGLVGDVTVEGDRVRVELVLTAGWRPFAGFLLQEVQRQVESLPEIARSEIAVVSGGVLTPSPSTSPREREVT
jgi:hypothetical protein